MSDGIDQSSGGQSEMLRQAEQQGSGQRDTEIGMNGTTDLGNNTTVSGGDGSGGDLSGSAAGATDGDDPTGQDQPGYGSNPDQGGQQQDAQDGDVQFDSDMNIDEEDDLPNGGSAASAAGVAV